MKQLIEEATPRRTFDEVIEQQQRTAEENCPFEIGQKIVNRREEFAIVERIYPSNNRTSYHMDVTKLKEDETIHEMPVCANKFDEWKSLQENGKTFLKLVK